MSSLALTLKETLRYRGAIGQWSWVLHRISGLGVLLFFVIHIIDTSWSVFYPHLYEEAISIYQTPLFTLGEFALVAAVVYHAYNGLRIVILDFKPQWWYYQQRAAVWVLIASAVTLLPVFVLMLSHVIHYYDGDPKVLGIDKVIESQIPFILGIAGAFIVALVFSGIGTAILGGDKPASGKGSKGERFWWSYMRISGVLIIPLVFGHLAMMHVIQGVFDLTVAGKTIAGVAATDGGLLTNGINDTGTAVEFVGERWNYLVASVAIWRFYDFALLALAAIHGFNGLRYVLTDYTMSNPLLRRAAIYVCVIGAAVLLLMGGGALVGTINDTAVREAERARLELVEFRVEEDFESAYSTLHENECTLEDEEVVCGDAEVEEEPASDEVVPEATPEATEEPSEGDGE